MEQGEEKKYCFKNCHKTVKENKKKDKRNIGVEEGMKNKEQGRGKDGTTSWKVRKKKVEEKKKVKIFIIEGYHGKKLVGGNV